MILGFVYTEYIRTQKFKQTASGSVRNQIEVAEDVSFYEMGGNLNYNISVKEAEVIQWYIKQHTTDYPDYNGQKISLMHWSI